MKKNFSIILLALGAAMFLWNVYGLLLDKAPSKEELIVKMKEEFAKHSTEMTFSDEKISEMADTAMKAAKAMSIGFSIFGLVLAFIGFRMFRKQTELDTVSTS